MRNSSGITLGLILLGLTACNDNLIDFTGEQHVRVYHDDQAIACSDIGAISVATHGKMLIDENIELHCSQKGHDGLAYTQSCGSETGSINIFTIHYKDLSKAESLGFSQLSTLTNAQLDKQCEFKVISDARKYDLLTQLNNQHDIWMANKTPNYQFQFNMSFNDCPTFAPTPTVVITVNNDTISTVYDVNSETFLTNTIDYMTIDELFTELNLKLKLPPIEAGLNPDAPLAFPIFNSMGVPEQYYVNGGAAECDAANYTISDFRLL